MSEALDKFKPLIQPEVPGCPEPMLEKWLNETIERFRKATEIGLTDEGLYNEWSTTIAAGTLGSLLMMQQFSFANPQMAEYYNRQFWSGVSDARIEVNRIKNGGKNLRVKPQPFV